jgi:hypothetical protein
MGIFGLCVGGLFYLTVFWVVESCSLLEIDVLEVLIASIIREIALNNSPQLVS